MLICFLREYSFYKIKAVFALQEKNVFIIAFVFGHLYTVGINIVVTSSTTRCAVAKGFQSRSEAIIICKFIKTPLFFKLT